MANRHLSRSIATQSLYEWDFSGCDNQKLQEIIDRNIKEFGPGMDDVNFIRQLISGVIDKKFWEG